jgi:hypothetical protein
MLHEQAMHTARIEETAMTIDSPGYVLAVVALVVALASVVHLWAWRETQRCRAAVGEHLVQHGFAPRAIELRFLTRGPFRDMPIPGLSQHEGSRLFRVLADDRHGHACHGWVRWRLQLPGRPREPWALQWDEPTTDERKFEGLAAWQFAAILLLLTGAAFAGFAVVAL